MISITSKMGGGQKIVLRGGRRYMGQNDARYIAQNAHLNLARQFCGLRFYNINR